MIAVGSECGYVTVLDVEILLESEWCEDAIVHVAKSSRPDIGNGPGAVRTMLFTPQPWDLLIWSEDQGRVCVADLRTGLITRQILELNAKEEGLNKVHISDYDVDSTIDPEQELHLIRRYRRALDSGGSSDFTTDYLEAAVERRARQNRHPQTVESDDDPNGLTSHERQVLESIQTTAAGFRNARDRISQAAQDVDRLVLSIPRSINYASDGNPTSTTEDTSRRIPSSTSPTPPILGPGPGLNALRDFLRDRPLADPDRRSFPLYRHTQLANATSSEDTPATGANATTASPYATANRYFSRSRPGIGSGQAQPLTDTEVLDMLHAGLGLNQDGTMSGLERFRTPQLELMLQHQRSRMANITASSLDATSGGNSTIAGSTHRPTAEEMQGTRELARIRQRVRNIRETHLSTYERYGRALHPELGSRTTGLAMSHDGRRLYAGTEEGIFEFEINAAARKMYPSITMR
jgi:hypothetical protein